MIDVFVYHSNGESLQFMKEVLKDYFLKVRYNFRISSSSNLEDSARYVKENMQKTNLYFIDFSDYESAKSIITYVKNLNETAMWVYMGEKEDVLKTLYLTPSAFLQKNPDREEILKTINVLSSIHRKKMLRDTFLLKYEGEYIRIGYDNIDYFESSGKHVMPHLSKEGFKYSFYAKLSDLETKLPSNFLRCHQSYIVNMKKVKKLDAKNHAFILENNSEVYISKRMFAETKKKYDKYLMVFDQI